jgi:hypothetical protein
MKKAVNGMLGTLFIVFFKFKLHLLHVQCTALHYKICFAFLSKLRSPTFWNF